MIAKRLPLIAAFGLVACGETIEELAPIPLVETVDATTQQCPAGGTVIRTGRDTNADGVLQDDEVTSEEPVCSGGQGDTGDPGPDGQRTIVQQVEEPAGDNCEFGGLRIEAGLDANGNDALDGDEITATTFVCTGDPAPDARALLTETSADVGDECPEAGGTLIRSGLDDDASGTLEEAEVDFERLVCAGDNSAISLVVIDDEPRGDNCAAGGQRFRFGRDGNGDGILQVGEVDETDYVCNPIPTLTSVTSLAPGSSTECPSGGQRVDVGADTNGNGVLESSEVNLTSYACNGTDGAEVLVRRQNLSPGAECADGGERVSYGSDTSGNGRLDPDEETFVTFVCDGANGQDGTEGSAVRVSTEPASANCVRGGTRIETGPDTNGNGVLDDGEVAATSFACNGPALAALTNVTPEPPGTNCADGGRRVETGTDDNGNGELDAAEVDNTSFVCATAAVVPIGFVTAPTLQEAIRNNAYSTTIEGIGGVGGAYQWSIATPSTAPPGLTIQPTGTPSTVLEGTPTATGNYTFDIEITDFFGNSATQTFTLEVTGTPLSITSFEPPRLQEGVAYSYQLTAAGGDTQTTPATWSVVHGTLPAGLTLSGAGLISGTPTTERGAFIIVEADDGIDTVRARLQIKGEQKFGAYCGDFQVDLQEDISVFSVTSTAPSVASPGTVVDNVAIEADCFEEVVISGQRDVIVFMGNETSSGTDELYAVDLSNFPNVGAPIKLNPTLPTSFDADVADFKVSPTGDWVAFRADDNVNFDEELFVYDLTALGTATPVRVNTATADIISESDYEWVPGTNKLVYIGDELASFEDSIFLYDADAGGTPTQLNGPLVSGGDVFVFAISPTGEYVAYVSDEDVDAQNRLYLVDISGATPGAPLEFSGAVDASADVGTTAPYDLGFSPNGDWVHFVVNFSGTGGDELYVRSIRNQAEPPVRLSQDLSSVSTLQDVNYALWAPDGRRIAFLGDVNTSAVEELFVADTLVPGSPIQISPDLGTSGDVNPIAGSAADETAWAPDSSYLIYDCDPNVTSQDEPYITFLDDPSNPIRMFPTGLSDDIINVKVSEDGETAFMVVELNGTSTQELVLMPIGSGSVGNATVINDPTPLGSTQDVGDTSSITNNFELVDGGSGVLYFSDEATTDDDEAFFRTISGTTVGSREQVNPNLPSGGDIETVVVQEE